MIIVKSIADLASQWDEVLTETHNNIRVCKEIVFNAFIIDKEGLDNSEILIGREADSLEIESAINGLEMEWKNIYQDPCEHGMATTAYGCYLKGDDGNALITVVTTIDKPEPEVIIDVVEENVDSTVEEI